MLGLSLEMGASGVLMEAAKLTSFFGDPVSAFALHIRVSRVPVDSDEEVWMSVENVEDVTKEDKGHGLSGVGVGE